MASKKSFSKWASSLEIKLFLAAELRNQFQTAWREEVCLNSNLRENSGFHSKLSFSFLAMINVFKLQEIMGFQQIDDTKAQLQSLRFGLACCRGIAAEK